MAVGSRGWTALALSWMGVIFLVSSIPDDSSGWSRRLLVLPPTWHNLLHVPVYALLAWLWWRALAARGMARRRAAAVAAWIAVAYGVSDEAHQWFVPGRFASATDVLLDAAGALLVWAVVRRQ